MTKFAFLASILLVVMAFASERESIQFDDNLLDAVTGPGGKQNLFVKTAAEKLAKSQVPTRQEAEKLALDSFVKRPGLDARESWRVSGLYVIGRGLDGFGKEGDLVWEVRISRLGSGVSGIVWVSTTTKNVKVLFPISM